MKTTSAILIAAISLLLGFFFRNATSPPAKASEELHEAATPSSRTRSASQHLKSLERTMKIPDSTQRWLRIVALLEKATLDEMQGIAESVGFADDKVSDLIAQRWLELDPQHFFESCLAEIQRTPSGKSANFGCYDFVEFLAKEWPQLNFEAALTAFSRPDSVKYLGDARGEFVNHLVKVDVDKAIQVHLAMNTGFWSNGMNYLRDAARKDPRSIAQTLFFHYATNENKNPDSLFFVSTKGGHFIEALAEAWGASDPVAALAFAKSHPNDQGKFLQDKVVQTWLMKDRLAATQWLEEQPDKVQEKYRSVSIRAWAVEDPRAALTWCLENLQDSPTLDNTMRSLLDGAVDGDVTQAAALIPTIEQEHLQYQALIEIVGEWFSPDLEGNIPTEAVAWIRDLGDTPPGKKAMQRAMYRWAKTDPDSMKSFLEEERAFDYPTEAYQQVATAITDRDPIEALAWSASLGQHSQSALSTASQIWLTKRPEAAINWLRSAPAQPAAEAAIEAIIAKEIKYPENLLIQKLGAENKAWLEAKFGK